MLEKKEYTQFGETIYSEELDNGLKVKLLSKKSFHKVYGIMSTNYGSADNEFVPYGKKGYESLSSRNCTFFRA